MKASLYNKLFKLFVVDSAPYGYCDITQGTPSIIVDRDHPKPSLVKDEKVRRLILPLQIGSEEELIKLGIESMRKLLGV
jgi:hypothetical protein